MNEEDVPLFQVQRELAFVGAVAAHYKEALEWLATCNPDTNDVNSIAQQALDTAGSAP